jgi:hypothetical protein
MKTLRLFSLTAACAAFISLSVCAQSVPAFNVTDMWWNPNESGWAVSMQQSSTTNQVYALWHTYDPRLPDPSTGNPNDYQPIWIAMTGATWTTPTTLVGDAYVTNATAYWLPYVPGSFQITRVGTFTFNFSASNRATFTYQIAPPAGISSTDPAFGLPTLTGTKSIQRFDF